jgi:hypothetical protein
MKKLFKKIDINIDYNFELFDLIKIYVTLCHHPNSQFFNFKNRREFESALKDVIASDADRIVFDNNQHLVVIGLLGDERYHQEYQKAKRKFYRWY